MALPYSDTTNLTGLIQLCETYSGLGNAAISGNSTLLKQFTRLLNNAFQKYVTTVLESQDDWDFDDSSITGTYPVATRSLVAAQRDYKFTSALWSLIGVEGGAAGSNAAITPLKIKRVDVTYDGTNWFKAEPFDVNETGLGLGNDTNTDARYVKTRPYYDIADNALWMYPMAVAADVTAGAKIQITFFREPTEFASTDTTKTAPIETAFAPMLPLDACVDYSIVNIPSITNALMARYADLEARLRRFQSTKNEDTVYTIKSAFTNYY